VPTSIVVMNEILGTPRSVATMWPQIALESKTTASGGSARSSDRRNGTRISVEARARATTRTGLPVRVASAMSGAVIVPGGYGRNRAPVRSIAPRNCSVE
jgi:hypothetical protein